jgi:hypothetical protein
LSSDLLWFSDVKSVSREQGHFAAAGQRSDVKEHRMHDETPKAGDNRSPDPDEFIYRQKMANLSRYAARAAKGKPLFEEEPDGQAVGMLRASM